MGIKRHKPEEVVTKLRQIEVLVGQGMAMETLIIGIQEEKMSYGNCRT